MSMDFKPGDRVAVVDGAEEDFGRRGKVVRVLRGVRWPIEVEFDGNVGFGALSPEQLEHEETYQSLCAQPVEKRPEDDPVKHPRHYTSHPSGVECKDIIGHYPFFIGSAIKYLWRAGLKTDNPIEDLRKAIKCIEFEIERLGGSVE